jgi:rRNA processing protein Krr1/Pno1
LWILVDFALVAADHPTEREDASSRTILLTGISSGTSEKGALPIQDLLCDPLTPHTSAIVKMDGLMQQPSWMLVGAAVVVIVIVQSLFQPKQVETTAKSAAPNVAATTTTTTKKKRKKSKKKSAAVVTKKEDPPVAVEETKEPVVEEPVPEPATTSKKKKKNKNKKGSTAPAAAKPQAKPKEETPKVEEPKEEVSPAAEVVEEYDDEDDDVARLLNANQLSKAQSKKKKKKKKKKNAAENQQPEKDDENWVMVNKQNKEESTAPAQPEPGAVHTVTLSLEAKDKHILVGPKGATIQNITTTSGARLDIDMPVLKITGTESAISVAMELVQDLLSENKAKSAFNTTLSGKEINSSEGVKAIIGKGGSTIKKIQSTTGCKIDANIDAGNVVITGSSEEQVQQAATLCRHAVFGEHQATMDLQDKSRVMLVLGKNFQKIRQFQDESGGAKLDIAKNTTILNISGPTDAVNKAKTMVTQWLNLCAGITLSIPQSAPGSFDKVGAIYGKGGATIRAIQDKTSAFIHVDDKQGKVQISGGPAAVQGALKMVQQAMEDGCLLEEGDVRDTITIPKKAGPTVIGRGGSNIKQLETNHQVKVRVSVQTCILIGKPAAVALCKTELGQTIEPFIEEERIDQEAERLASEQEAASAVAGAWNASIHDDAADGW